MTDIVQKIEDLGSKFTQGVDEAAAEGKVLAADAATLLQKLFTPGLETAIIHDAEVAIAFVKKIEDAQAAGDSPLVAVVTAIAQVFKSTPLAAPATDETAPAQSQGGDGPNG